MDDYIPENLQPIDEQTKLVMPVWTKPLPDKNEKICDRCHKRQIPTVRYVTYCSHTDMDIACRELSHKKTPPPVYRLSDTIDCYFCSECGCKNFHDTPEQDAYESYLYEYNEYVRDVNARMEQVKPKTSIMPIISIGFGVLTVLGVILAICILL